MEIFSACGPNLPEHYLGCRHFRLFQPPSRAMGGPGVRQGPYTFLWLFLTHPELILSVSRESGRDATAWNRIEGAWTQ